MPSLSPHSSNLNIHLPPFTHRHPSVLTHSALSPLQLCISLSQPFISFFQPQHSSSAAYTPAIHRSSPTQLLLSLQPCISLTQPFTSFFQPQHSSPPLTHRQSIRPPPLSSITPPAFHIAHPAFHLILPASTFLFRRLHTGIHPSSPTQLYHPSSLSYRSPSLSPHSSNLNIPLPPLTHRQSIRPPPLSSITPPAFHIAQPAFHLILSASTFLFRRLHTGNPSVLTHSALSPLQTFISLTQPFTSFFQPQHSSSAAYTPAIHPSSPTQLYHPSSLSYRSASLSSHSSNLNIHLPPFTHRHPSVLTHSALSPLQTFISLTQPFTSFPHHTRHVTDRSAPRLLPLKPQLTFISIPYSIIYYQL